MHDEDIKTINEEIASYKKIRDNYKKQFWLKAPSMSHKKRARIENMFKKIDRCRNRLHLWLKQLSSRRIKRKTLLGAKLQHSRSEIQAGFKQLDAALYRS